ncbi:MAG: serine hydrolase, partial [Mycobacteriales bacterium]
RLHLDEGRAQDGRELLSPSSVKTMQTRQVDIPVRGHRDGWGLGWSLGSVDGERLIGHGGGTLGHLSTLEVLPDRRLAVVVLTNAPGGVAVGQTLVGHVFDRLAGVRLVDPDAAAAVVEVDLRPYVGSYRSRATSIEVRLDGDRLTASVAVEKVVAEIPSPGQTWNLLPLGADRFRVDGAGPLQMVQFLRTGPDHDPEYVFAGRLYPRARSGEQQGSG